MKQIILILLTVFILTSCEFISNTFIYKDKTEDFVETLLKEDYNKCVDLMAMDHELANNTNVDTMKIGLANFRENIVKYFGSELDYKFINAEKRISTDESENTPPNSTDVLVQFSNEKDFGILKVLYDDKSKKILNITKLDIKEPIPSMISFWLVGLLAICVPIFNIYILLKIKRSNLNKKWWKYIAVLLLNVPTFTYTAINGISFSLLNFQFLFGISFSFMGYLYSSWSVGLPLGGLYWYWKLSQQSKLMTEAEPIISYQTKTVVEED